MPGINYHVYVGPEVGNRTLRKLGLTMSHFRHRAMQQGCEL